MNSLSANSALLVIDVQQAFNNPSWGSRNNPDAELNIATLLGAWRKSGRPIFHIHHRSPRASSLFHPNLPGFEIKAETEPQAGEPILFKEVNSAFIGTDLEARLR